MLFAEVRKKGSSIIRDWASDEKIDEAGWES